MYGDMDFTTILLPRGLPDLMYQRFQRFNHVNLTTCGGAAGAGRSQLPLCGPVRRLRENQRETTRQRVWKRNVGRLWGRNAELWKSDNRMAVASAQRLFRRCQESLRALKKRELSGIIELDLLRKEGP